jgi:hypothetical protein
MKPRIRKVDGFWRCTTPDAQGIGVTPKHAHGEFMDVSINELLAKVEADRREWQRREIEYATQTATIQMRTLMAAHGLVTDDDGKVIKDLLMGSYLERAAPATAPAPASVSQTPKQAPRWWEFWK